MSSPMKATQDLWQIAKNGNVGQLQAILSRGGNLNASNDAGVTALMVAAYHGRLEMVRALTDHGADVNAADRDGFTAAMLAGHQGHHEIVRTLVARGARIVPKSHAAHVSPAPSPEDVTVDSLREPKVTHTKAAHEVRTLHEPPDIWDLVHETHTDFKPRSALVSHLASINPLVLATIALIVGGGAVLWFVKWKSSPGRDRAVSSAPLLSSAPSESTAPPATNPSVAPARSVEAPPQAEDGKAKTASGSQVSEPKTSAAASSQKPPSTVEIAGNSVDTQTAVATPSALPAKRVAPKPRRENPTSPTLTGDAFSAGNKEKSEPVPTPAAKADNEKSGNPPAAKKEPEKPPSPQLTTPAKASPTPKAKVIQWP